MATNTTIEWTDKTWNPTRGCSRVTDECAHCYAEPIAHRFGGPGKPYEGLVHSTGAWNGQIRLVPDLLTDPLRWINGHRVFVNSMSDLFHENVPFEFVDKVMAVMACTTRHTYQVLTKRPDRMVKYLERLDDSRIDSVFEWPELIRPLDVWPQWTPHREGKRGGYDCCGPIWPLVNVWFGISAGRQAAFDERWEIIEDADLDLTGWNLFLSAEPLLEALGIALALPRADMPYGPKLKWVICGGESGPGARPCALGWLKDIVRQCSQSETPVFVKQVGACPTNREGERCPHITDRKGGDIEEWPAELRIRLFPKPA